MRSAVQRAPTPPIIPPTPLARGAKDMRLSTARDEFITYRRLGTKTQKALAPLTLRRYYWALVGFCDWIKVSTGKDSVLLFTAERAHDYITHRSSNGTEMSTLAVDCSAISEFGKWGVRRRLWPAELVPELPRAQADKGLPRPLPPEHRDRVMSLALNVKDHAARALLYYAGLRESEAISLLLQHVTPPHGDNAGALSIFGKGRKQRVIPMHPALWQALEPLMPSRLSPVNLDTPVLTKPNGGHWSARMVLDRCQAWAEAAGVTRFTPHQLRHTFATDTLEEHPEKLLHLSELMGHESVATTQIYAKVVNKQKAAMVFSLPTFGPTGVKS